MDTTRIRSTLAALYGEGRATELSGRLESLMERWKPRLAKAIRAGSKVPFSEKDALLISYGDMLSPPSTGIDGRSGLGRLKDFMSSQTRGASGDAMGQEEEAGGGFSCLHILPFCPYSSDDGFSVMDYREVDPRLGAWGDIERLGEDFRLAFDLVLNHSSAVGTWFKAFLKGDEPYDEYFITRGAGYDSSSVVRPRTHPLLTPFMKADGSEVLVWTTFSADQVDLDFSNPQVLLEFLDIMLSYVDKGARILRLDAIAYLWKEDGTPCLHHPKTHEAVKLFRAVADALDLDLVILTETNVPHPENVSYWGGGREAHMVYNFALPPLVLHAAVSGDARPLARWARALPPPGEGPLFLNFLASHDGVGVTPARGLVPDEDFAKTIEAVVAKGGLVSYKATPAGEIPYELNCSYLDAVAPRATSTPPSARDDEIAARAFLCAYAVAMALPGLPAVYFHSWIGSRAWAEGPSITGMKRTINREKPPIDRVLQDLEDPQSLRSRVMGGFDRLLAFRSAHPAFAPPCPMKVLETGDATPSVFALERGPDASGARVLCLQNLGGTSAVPPDLPGTGETPLEPWETRWIAIDPDGRVEATLRI